jgi:hypothetical protein
MVVSGSGIKHPGSATLDGDLEIVYYLPDTDEVVAVASKEGLTVSAPGHGQALRWVSTAGPGHLKLNMLSLTHRAGAL